jgi:hypothetical protein
LVADEEPGSGFRVIAGVDPQWVLREVVNGLIARADGIERSEDVALHERVHADVRALLSPSRLDALEGQEGARAREQCVRELGEVMADPLTPQSQMKVVSWRRRAAQAEQQQADLAKSLERTERQVASILKEDQGASGAVGFKRTGARYRLGKHMDPSVAASRRKR